MDTKFYSSKLVITSIDLSFIKICPGLNANEIRIPRGKHHKVFSLVKSHQDTRNSVKYEVKWKCQITVAFIPGHKFIYQDLACWSSFNLVLIQFFFLLNFRILRLFASKDVFSCRLRSSWRGNSFTTKHSAAEFTLNTNYGDLNDKDRRDIIVMSEKKF